MVESIINSPKWGVDAVKGAGDEHVEFSLHPCYVTGTELCISIRHQATEHDGTG